MTETVYLKRKTFVKSQADQVYHTEQCNHYEKAADPDRFKEVSLDEVPPEARECKTCAGTADHNTDQVHKMKNLLERCDPEDIGMTPIGER